MYHWFVASEMLTWKIREIMIGDNFIVVLYKGFVGVQFLRTHANICTKYEGEEPFSVRYIHFLMIKTMHIQLKEL